MCTVGEYYRDPLFMTELNLQRVRRELIRLLDESEKNECFACNRLRCCCHNPKPEPEPEPDNSSVRSSTLSVLTSETYESSSKSSASRTSDMKEAAEAPVAPPAEALPKPEWVFTVAAWIESTTCNIDPKPDLNISQDIDNSSRNIFDSQDIDFSNLTQEIKTPNEKNMNLPAKTSKTQVTKLLSSFARNINEEAYRASGIKEVINPVTLQSNVSLNYTAPVTTYASLNTTTIVTTQHIGLGYSTPIVTQSAGLYSSTPIKPYSASFISTPAPRNMTQNQSANGGNPWTRPVWGFDGAKSPAGEQNPDSVQAFFRSFSEVAGSGTSSTVGYSYF